MFPSFSRSKFFLLGFMLLGLFPFLLGRHFRGRPEYSQIFLRRGEEFLRAGETERARRYLERASFQHAGSAQAYRALAEYFEERGDRDAAMGYWARSVAVDPGAQEGYYRLGLAAFEAGCYPLAEKSIQKAIHIGGNYRVLGDYYFALARCYLAEGQKSLAFSQIETLRKVDRSDLAQKLQKSIENGSLHDRN